MASHDLTQFSKSITELNSKLLTLETSLKAEIVKQNNTDELKTALLAELQKPRSTIKSIQRGSFSGSYAHITRVDAAKSVLICTSQSSWQLESNAQTGIGGSALNSGDPEYYQRAYRSSFATVPGAYLHSNGSTIYKAGSGTIYWQVIEYV